MKDEIKEILDNIKSKYEDYYVQDIVSGNDLKILLDYITNLQEEKDKYKNIVDKALCFLEATERITNNPLNDENNFERLWINYHEDRIENIDKLASILKGE